MVSRKHRPMSVRAFQYALAQWAQRAGIVHEITPHWLRHTRAMNILRRSTAREPLRLVQAALGHANLASTGVYIRVSREELEAELTAVDGRKGRTSVAQLRRQFELRLEAAA
jgi:site-specific recombinase XerD